MRSYETARSLFGFLEFLAWSGVVLGVLVAFMGADSMSNGPYGGSSGATIMLAAMPGIAVAVFSLLNVAIVQGARATVDTAEYSQQMLKVARDQLEVSKQGQAGKITAQSTFADAGQKAGRKKPKMAFSNQVQAADQSNDLVETPEMEPQPKLEDFVHKNMLVQAGSDKYFLAGKYFASKEEVKHHIDALYGTNPKPLEAG